MPLVTIGTFVVLKDTGVVSAGAIETPYSVYASVGVAIWQLFAQGLIAGANSLSSGGDMITRINFSKMSLVIASMGKAVISSAVLALLCVGVIVYNLTAGSWTWTFGVQMLLFPLMLLPVVALTVGLSFYLAILNAVVRDIGTLLGILLTFLMLLTPVLYQKPPVGAGGGKVIVELLSTYNPLYYLVTAPRDLLLRGSVDVGAGFWISTGVAAAVFFFGVLSFHLAEARIAERM